MQENTSLVYFKEYSSGTAKWKRCRRQGVGKELRASMPSLGPPPSQHTYVFTNLESPQILLFKRFYNLISSPPLSRGQGVGLIVLTL